MVASKLHHGRRSPLKKKPQLLSNLPRPRHVEKISSIEEAEAYICKLMLLFKEIEGKYVKLMNLLMNIPKEVKVEKIEAGFHVKISCEKGGDKLVSILEAFEQMGLDVVQAKVSCDVCFTMEAIVAAEAQDLEATVEVRVMTQTILKAIDTSR